MSARKIDIVLGSVLNAFVLLGCSQPPAPPVVGASTTGNSGTQTEGGATTFNAATYFNSGCQVCHAGSTPQKDLSGGGYDGELVEESLSFTSAHSRYQDTWPTGDDADDLADYINTTIAGE